MKKSTSRELNDNIRLILEIPERVNLLDIIGLKEHLIYVKREEQRSSDKICGMIEVNPNYRYPKETEPDKLFEYWAEKYSMGGFYYSHWIYLIKLFENKLQDLNKDIRIKPATNFESFLVNVPDKSALVRELKNTFKTEVGINIRIMIELLRDHKLLVYGHRDFKNLFKSIEICFERNIGTYQSVNDNYKHSDDDKITYKSNIDAIHEKLSPLITKYSATY